MLDVAGRVEQALRESLKLSSEQLIDVNADLKQDLGLDSMTSLTFLMALEECIDGFTVNAGTLETKHLQTVKTVIEYVKHEIEKQRQIQDLSINEAVAG